MLNSGEFRASIRRAGPLAAAVALSLAPFATPAYASPINLGSGVATYTGQIATYLVGTSGLYDITAVGANGGQSSNGNLGGIGAQVSGEFNLTAGEQLLVLVGGAGTATGTDDAGGGGGGYSGGGAGNGGVNSDTGGGGGGGGSYLASTALQTSEHADANTNSDLLGNGLVQFRAVQASVPEPGPLGLLGAGLLALFVSGRRRTRNAQG